MAINIVMHIPKHNFLPQFILYNSLSLSSNNFNSSYNSSTVSYYYLSSGSSIDSTDYSGYS